MENGVFVFSDVCWIQVKGKVVVDARIFKYGSLLLVDDIMTNEKFRRKGYASQLIDRLKDHCRDNGWTLGAYGIVKTKAAKEFWAKHKVEDYFETLQKEA